MPANTVTVSVIVKAPLERAWETWVTPEHITAWNFASPDWHCPSASNDLRVGGQFSSRMEARDGSMGFDFAGEYLEVEPQQRLVTQFGDRRAEVSFKALSPNETSVTQTFDPEDQNPIDMQRAGWQAILENYKRHTESL